MSNTGNANRKSGGSNNSSYNRNSNIATGRGRVGNKRQRPPSNHSNGTPAVTKNTRSSNISGVATRRASSSSVDRSSYDEELQALYAEQQKIYQEMVKKHQEEQKKKS